MDSSQIPAVLSGSPKSVRIVLTEANLFKFNTCLKIDITLNLKSVNKVVQNLDLRKYPKHSQNEC